MRQGREKKYLIKIFLCSGILYGCFILYDAKLTLLRANENPFNILQNILELELKDAQLVNQNPEQHIFSFVYQEETINVKVSGPIETDLDKDGEKRLIVGCTIANRRWLKHRNRINKDWLGIYVIGENNSPTQLFRKQFENVDWGDFVTLQLEDMTGDGIPEIKVIYSSEYAGARNFGWEDTLYLIQGQAPFDSLLELKVAQNDPAYQMKTEITIKDIDLDGLNEILVTRYEGKSEESMKKTALHPLIYHLKEGRYQLTSGSK